MVYYFTYEQAQRAADQCAVYFHRAFEVFETDSPFDGYRFAVREVQA